MKKHRAQMLTSSIVGLMLCALGYLFYVNSAEYLGSLKQAKGEITDIVLVDSDGDKAVYDVIVTFDAEAKKGVKFVMEQTLVKNEGLLGKKVNVIYSIDLAEDAIVVTFFSLWGFPILFSAIGVCLLIGSIVFFIAGKRRTSE